MDKKIEGKMITKMVVFKPPVFSYMKKLIILNGTGD